MNLPTQILASLFAPLMFGLTTSSLSFAQPRSQGLSSLPPLVVGMTKGGREERPWERGCLSLSLLCDTKEAARNNWPRPRGR